MNEPDLYAYQLRMRAERLLKLVELNAPLVVIANEVVLVMTAAAGHCGDKFGAALQGFFLRAARNSMQRCVACGHEERDPQTELCKLCTAEAEATDLLDRTPS